MTVNYILTCVFVLASLGVYSKDQPVVLEWKFTGIEEGYDHLNRCKLFVDGNEIPVSKSCKQSEWGNSHLKLSRRKHQIKLVNEAFFNGKWVEHTFENGFSINAVCEFELDVAEVAKMRIEFDLNKKAVSITRFDEEGKDLSEKIAVFRGKHYPMSISWKFIHVEKGYDHRSRMVVYVDDLKYGVSPESIESSGAFYELRIPKGEHTVRIVNQSFVNGVWQDHTILNNFSVEAVYEKKVHVKKAVQVVLVIDLNNEQTVNEWR
ncbi:hypothetical protein D3C87_196910 [compost metagenome]